jgi:hypothetical protein
VDPRKRHTIVKGYTTTQISIPQNYIWERMVDFVPKEVKSRSRFDDIFTAIFSLV